MKYLFSFLIISFLLTTNVPYCSAQAPIEAPKTLEEAKSLGERFLWGLPEALKGIWQEALAIWRKMIDYISPWFKSVWYKIDSFLGREVEKRKSDIKEEFEKEKQEMKEEVKTEVPKIGKSLWERFKELIK